jgi:hypothetical protein
MASQLYEHVRDFLALRDWTWDAAAGMWLAPGGERHADDSEAFRWYRRVSRSLRAEGGAGHD